MTRTLAPFGCAGEQAHKMRDEVANGVIIVETGAEAWLSLATSANQGSTSLWLIYTTTDE